MSSILYVHIISYHIAFINIAMIIISIKVYVLNSVLMLNGR